MDGQAVRAQLQVQRKDLKSDEPKCGKPGHERTGGQSAPNELPKTLRSIAANKSQHEEKAGIEPDRGHTNRKTKHL